MTTPDASLHLGLLGHVIRQMGLRGDLAEEAYSEGLVTLTVACQNYDEARGLPLAHWLARNVRWSILNWMNKQHQEIPYALQSGVVVEPIERSNTEVTVLLKEVITVAKEILQPQEFLAVMGKAYGYKGKELARAMNCSQGQVSKLQQRGIRKLKAEINLP